MNNLNTQILSNDRILAELVRRLVKAFHPERIFLFGSKAGVTRVQTVIMIRSF